MVSRGEEFLVVARGGGAWCLFAKDPVAVAVRGAGRGRSRQQDGRPRRTLLVHWLHFVRQCAPARRDRDEVVG